MVLKCLQKKCESGLKSAVMILPVSGLSIIQSRHCLRGSIYCFGCQFVPRFYWGYKEGVFIVSGYVRLVPKYVGPLVVGGGIWAQQLSVLCTVLAGCMQRVMSTQSLQNFLHHSEPGFSERIAVCLTVYGVLGTSCQFNIWIIAVGLLWRRQSLFRVIYVMYISDSSPLHRYRQVC